MNKYFRKLSEYLLEDKHRESQKSARFDLDDLPKPVIWLLGKTGAGKTSLIHYLTGLESAVIGNGFEPCTRTSREFVYPLENPFLRFLDTRGLAEIQYDPKEDLQECMDRSHLVLVVARMDDPMQADIVRAIKRIRKQSAASPFIVVHTGADLFEDSTQSDRAWRSNQLQFEQAIGEVISNVVMALPGDSDGAEAQGMSDLLELLANKIPEVALLLQSEQSESREKQAFASVRAQVIRYSTAAGASDLAPGVGVIAVPSIQAAMFRSLGEHYQIKWTRRHLTELSVALGVGVLARFGGSYLSRQVAKFIPVYGQTLGAAAAGAISFASTFALGRSAAYYLYQLTQGREVNQQQVRDMYHQAFRQAMETLRKK